MDKITEQAIREAAIEFREAMVTLRLLLDKLFDLVEKETQDAKR